MASATLGNRKNTTLTDYWEEIQFKNPIPSQDIIQKQVIYNGKKYIIHLPSIIKMLADI